jgi:hypothetical protein
LNFMPCLLCCERIRVSGTWPRSAPRISWFNQLAFELHGRGEFFVLGRELGVEQEEFLDLLDAGKLLVHPVDLFLDQFLHLRGARQAGVVAEGHVVHPGQTSPRFPGRS